MKIQRANLSTCHTASGVAVVIDVLRAFTTAAHFFNAGVSQIYLTGEVEEAFELRRRMPGCLISGEIDGVQVEGFDLGNSPSALQDLGLSGRQIIQRTTAGTQGVILSTNAQTILTAALTNASATARYIQKLAPSEATFILTGQCLPQWSGDEDAACADLIEAYLLGEETNLQAIASRVRNSGTGRRFDGHSPHFPPSDLELALEINRFNFAMLVERQDGQHILRKVEA